MLAKCRPREAVPCDKITGHSSPDRGKTGRASFPCFPEMTYRARLRSAEDGFVSFDSTDRDNAVPLPAASKNPDAAPVARRARKFRLSALPRIRNRGMHHR